MRVVAARFGLIDRRQMVRFDEREQTAMVDAEAWVSGVAGSRSHVNNHLVSLPASCGVKAE